MDINGPRLKAGKLCKMDVYTTSSHQPCLYEFLIHWFASFDGILFSFSSLKNVRFIGHTIGNCIRDMYAMPCLRFDHHSISSFLMLPSFRMNGISILQYFINTYPMIDYLRFYDSHSRMFHLYMQTSPLPVKGCKI
jgi:hypothetical protein